MGNLRILVLGNGICVTGNDRHKNGKIRIAIIKTAVV
jgi:hypothetical protein